MNKRAGESPIYFAQLIGHNGDGVTSGSLSVRVCLCVCACVLASLAEINELQMRRNSSCSTAGFRIACLLGCGKHANSRQGCQHSVSLIGHKWGLHGAVMQDQGQQAPLWLAHQSMLALHVFCFIVCFFYDKKANLILILKYCLNITLTVQTSSRFASNFAVQHPKCVSSKSDTDHSND